MYTLYVQPCCFAKYNIKPPTHQTQISEKLSNTLHYFLRPQIPKVFYDFANPHMLLINHVIAQPAHLISQQGFEQGDSENQGKTQDCFPIDNGMFACKLYI